MLRDDIKSNYINLCNVANHNLSRDEYRVLNTNPEYSTYKIEIIWGNWGNFIKDINKNVRLSRFEINKTVKNSVKDIVITSVIDGSEIDSDCLETLKTYVKDQNCEFYILWGKSIKSNKLFDIKTYEKIKEYLVTNLSFNKDPTCLALDLLIPATCKNPLSNLDKLSKNLNTIIVGSTKQYLESLPRDIKKPYKIALSTGTISKPEYKNTIQGMLDLQNHTLGALRLQWDSDQNRYITRQLQYKNSSIFDINKKEYTKDKIKSIKYIDGIVLGDFHAPETDIKCLNNTIKLINELNIKQIVLHDWISYQSINHHEMGKCLTQIMSQTDYTKDLKTELNYAKEFVNKLSDSCKNSNIKIVHSNHDDFLIKWLNSGEFVKGELNNRLIGCELFYKIASNKNIFDKFFHKNVEILEKGTIYEINGIEVGKHGDIGISGAKGTPNSYVKSYNKTVTGHTHSPKIKESGVVVGTSSKLELFYNKNSISTWAHAHCIIYKNGSFQLIFV